MKMYDDDRFNAQKDKMNQHKDKSVTELKAGVDEAEGFHRLPMSTRSRS